MSESLRPDEELQALLAAVVEGDLSAVQTARLQELLQSDPARREFYVRFMATHALLRWTHAGPSSISKPESTPAAPAAPAPVAGHTALTPESAPGAAGSMLWTGGSSGFAFSYPVVFSLLFLLAAGGVFVFPKFFSGKPASNDAPSDVAMQPADAPNPAIAKAELAAVAKLTAGEGCQWGDAPPVLRIGDGISIGQSLVLTSGVAEFTFDIGARVILQSPASFSVTSSKSIRLQNGKLTAEITRAQARGFEVLTPEATFVDQGTEFGVEVAPGGSSRVHVFKGEVDLALSNKSRTALPTHRLLANSGARLEADASHVTLVEDTGESFLRSMDQAGRDLHTVAYWRFEDHPVGTLLPDTQLNKVAMRATVDSSFNGNDLFTYFQVHSARVF